MSLNENVIQEEVTIGYFSYNVVAIHECIVYHVTRQFLDTMKKMLFYQRLIKSKLYRICIYNSYHSH